MGVVVKLATESSVHLESPARGRLHFLCDYGSGAGMSQTETETLFLFDAKPFLKDKEEEAWPGWHWAGGLREW